MPLSGALKMAETKEKDIRELFLRELVRNLIMNYPTEPEPVPLTMPPAVAPQAPEAPRALPRVPQVPGVPQVPQVRRPEPQRLIELTNLILDPEIYSIECPGPERYIMINKKGRIQPIGIRLTREEIARTMNEFSRKTKIPLVSGIFKAVLGHIIVTAVISEHVGTRFLIQKTRIPLQAPKP